MRAAESLEVGMVEGIAAIGDALDVVYLDGSDDAAFLGAGDA